MAKHASDQLSQTLWGGVFTLSRCALRFMDYPLHPWRGMSAVLLGQDLESGLLSLVLVRSGWWVEGKFGVGEKQGNNSALYLQHRWSVIKFFRVCPEWCGNLRTITLQLFSAQMVIFTEHWHIISISHSPGLGNDFVMQSSFWYWTSYSGLDLPRACALCERCHNQINYMVHTYDLQPWHVCPPQPTANYQVLSTWKPIPLVQLPKTTAS